MIWLRRTAAVALGILLLLVLLGTLMLQSVNATLLNPDFYMDQLEDADVYAFVMDNALSSAVDEARDQEPGDIDVDLRANPVEASGLSTSGIVEAVQRALSAEDLEALVAPSVREVAGYVTGRSDTFTIDLPLAETIRDLVDELLALMREEDVYERLLELELEPRVDETAGQAVDPDDDAPRWVQQLFGSDDQGNNRLAEVVTGALTPEWFATQVEHVVNELTSYLVGDTEDFELRIRLSDALVAAAVEDLKSVLHEADAFDFVYTDILDPTVEDNLDETITLPYGVEVGRDEVSELLRQAAPRPWVQQQADLLIDDVSAYVTGRSEGFATSISLVERKETAAGLLTELAVARVEESVRGLPACSADAEAGAIAALGGGRIPDCLPPGVPVDDLLVDVRAAITEAIPPLVLGPVPDAVTYSDSDLRLELREAGGPDALAALDDVRELLSEGWSYSAADLRADLASEPDLLDGLDRVRAFVADGYVHTPDDPSASGLGVVLDELHEVSSDFRGGERAAWLIVAVLLVAIGALGGTSWSGRVVWASGSLLAAAVAILFQFWPVYEVISGGLAELAREEIAAQSSEDLGDTARLGAEKLVDLVEGAADDFAGGVRRPAFVVAAIALVVLLAAVFSGRFIRPDRTLQEQALDGR
ncbi:MAG: hypothetical protein F4X76_12175 [Chloroflexi bacterium]|nr:hypothetical protein [Chloroflexota bacterium]